MFLGIGNGASRYWRWHRQVQQIAFAFSGVFAALLIAFFGALYLSISPNMSDAQRPETLQISVHFEACTRGSRFNCVVDGDTLWLGGEKIRVMDIDTPEVLSPKCDFELKLGKRATLRLIELLNAGPFEIHENGARNRDRYGRQLRVIARNGQSLGELLVAEGLARSWDGARRGWCA